MQSPFTPCWFVFSCTQWRLIGILGAFIHFSCERDRPRFARVHRNPFIRVARVRFYPLPARFSILELTRFSLRPKTSINHAMSVVLIKHLWSLYFITIESCRWKILSFSVRTHKWDCPWTSNIERANRMARQRSNRVHMWTLRTFGTLGWCEPSNEWIGRHNRIAIVIVVSRFFDIVAVSMGIVYG